MYPYLSYRDTAAALRFLEEAFGFTTSVRWDTPNGTVQRAEVTFGDGAVMRALPTPQPRRLDLEGYEWSFGSYRPGTTGGS